MTTVYKELEKIDGLSAEDFHRSHVGQKPIVFTPKGYDWGAIGKWNAEYFRNVAGDIVVKARPTRYEHVPGVRTTEFITLDEYLSMLREYIEHMKTAPPDEKNYPPYLHDTPLLKSSPQLTRDLANFPKSFLPEWYRKDWIRFALFFIGPANALTPLHFDSCMTHNLFFQMAGRKVFTIILSEYSEHCYPFNWQWSPIDPENPDYEKYPKFRDAEVFQCVLNPGDILYMPPGVWYQVRSLDETISFNFDWHTRKSAVSGFFNYFRGMPFRNAFVYNLTLAAGLTFGIPSRWLSPVLDMHLDYVD